jgi:hypothetical protein
MSWQALSELSCCSKRWRRFAQGDILLAIWHLIAQVRRSSGEMEPLITDLLPAAAQTLRRHPLKTGYWPLAFARCKNKMMNASGLVYRLFKRLRDGFSSAAVSR